MADERQADFSTVPLTQWRQLAPEEAERRAREFLREMARRRTVRNFSDRPVPRQLIEDCIRTAGTAPSGANLQPWYFVAVSDAATKHRIRLGAEEEEREFYGHRAPQAWIDALAPFGTDENKPFLETAPWLIAAFVQRTGTDDEGNDTKHYYANESTGLACGLLITALHRAGLASLTHTPSPMRFLNEILGRPASESPFLLLVVGYPADDCRVPDIERKRLREIADFV